MLNSLTEIIFMGIKNPRGGHTSGILETTCDKIKGIKYSFKVYFEEFYIK